MLRLKSYIKGSILSFVDIRWDNKKMSNIELLIKLEFLHLPNLSYNFRNFENDKKL